MFLFLRTFWEIQEALRWSVKDVKHLAREPGLAHLRVQ